MTPLYKTLTHAQDSARTALLNLTRDRPPPVQRPAGEPLRVLITIDTEISMGGALAHPELQPVGVAPRIWGEVASGRRYGIELFMDLFEEHDMRGVFFFEPVAQHLVPIEELKHAARVITERGHDIELHIHPEFKMNLEDVRRGVSEAPDARMYAHSREAQRAYFKSALDDLEAWTGRRPCAYRAGSHATDSVGMDVCVDTGVPIDSSYNLWAIQAGICKLPPSPALNDVTVLPNGVVEVPVTNLKARGPRGGLKPFELSSLSTTEMIATLDQLYEAGARTCCTMTHSFRLIRTTNEQYRNAVLDRFNLHRLKALLRYLDNHRDRFTVCTYRDLPLERWREELGPPPEEPFFPTPPLWSSVSRLAVQAVKDRGAV